MKITIAQDRRSLSISCVGAGIKTPKKLDVFQVKLDPQEARILAYHLLFLVESTDWRIEND